MHLRQIIAILFALLPLNAQSPANVLIVINDNSPVSRDAGEYYARRRGIELTHLCRIHASVEETVTRPEYTRTIAAPVAQFLRQNQLTEKDSVHRHDRRRPASHQECGRLGADGGRRLSR